MMFFKMIITKLYYFDLIGKQNGQKISGSKNFKQKLHHQAVEAKVLRVKVEVIQKLLLPHPWEKH